MRPVVIHRRLLTFDDVLPARRCCVVLVTLVSDAATGDSAFQLHRHRLLLSKNSSVGYRALLAALKARISSTKDFGAVFVVPILGNTHSELCIRFHRG